MIKQISFVLAALIGASDAVKQTSSSYTGTQTESFTAADGYNISNTSSWEKTGTTATYDHTAQNTGTAGTIVSGGELGEVADPK